MAQMRYSFPFEHRGMLQGDRPAQAPSGNAIEVSGRRFDDLVMRTAQFARNVLFYGEDNTENVAFFVNKEVSVKVNGEDCKYSVVIEEI